jgi:A/G-specific adenine glycosylase
MAVARELVTELGSWFGRGQRVLPWRSRPEPYRVWISEIMLQQTQVVTVIPFFEKFVERFPSVEDLASASGDEVMKYWAGLGYYSRARNLHRAAKQVVEAGRFPRSRDEWLELSGVGPYTAGAIASISNNQVEPIVDGNVERVISRIRRLSDFGPSKKALWGWSEAFVRLADRYGVPSSVFNQAMMELGATICTPKKPDCRRCPVRKHCRARIREDQAAFPPKKKRKEWKKVDERVVCLRSPEGQVLLRLRGEGEWRAGLWDLPESIPGTSSAWQKVGESQTRHIVTNHKVSRTTEVYRPAQSRVSESQRLPEGFRWVSPGEMTDIPMGNAAKKTLREVDRSMPLDPDRPSH